MTSTLAVGRAQAEAPGLLLDYKGPKELRERLSKMAEAHGVHVKLGRAPGVSARARREGSLPRGTRWLRRGVRQGGRAAAVVWFTLRGVQVLAVDESGTVVLHERGPRDASDVLAVQWWKSVLEKLGPSPAPQSLAAESEGEGTREGPAPGEPRDASEPEYANESRDESELEDASESRDASEPEDESRHASKTEDTSEPQHAVELQRHEGEPQQRAELGTTAVVVPENDPSEPTLLVAALDLGWGGRMLRYHGQQTSNLRAHDLPAALVLGLAAELYVFSRYDVGPLAGLGWIGHVRQSLMSATTFASDGQPVEIPTPWTTWGGGVCYRLSLGSFVLRGSVQIAQETVRFRLQFEDLRRREVPEVMYTFIDAGLLVGWHHGPWRIGVEAGVAPVLSGGSIRERYLVGAQMLGIGGSLQVAWQLWGALGVQLTLNYKAFIYRHSPSPEDLYRAQGAEDHLLNARAGLRLEL